MTWISIGICHGYFMLICLMRELVVRIFDMFGIVDHHGLNINCLVT